MKMKINNICTLPWNLKSEKKYIEMTNSIETYEDFTKIFDSIVTECLHKFSIYDLCDVLWDFTCDVCLKFVRNQNYQKKLNFDWYCGYVSHNLVEKNVCTF